MTIQCSVGCRYNGCDRILAGVAAAAITAANVNVALSSRLLACCSNRNFDPAAAT